MKRVLMAALLVTGCGPDPWYAEHQTRCQAWMARARDDSQRMQVEMTCEAIKESYEAKQEAHRAALMSSAAMGMAAGATASGGR